MNEISFGEFLDLKFHPRSKKPRKQGISMVLDSGYSNAEVAGIVESYGHLIDIAKLVDLNLSLPLNLLKEKIRIYREHDIYVQPGGIIIELARLQGKGRQVLERLHELGFNAIEISSSATTQREIEEEKEFIDITKAYDFSVSGEVGKKFHHGDKTRISDTQLKIEETVREMKAFLVGGVKKIYWEGHVLRRIMGDTESDILSRHPAATEQILKVTSQVGAENLVFEVSIMVPYAQRRAQQFWLVRLFGPDVNIGNIRLNEIQFLEHIRLGTWPVFGFGSLGDHPYMQSLVKGNGKASSTWWKDIPIETTI